MAPDSLQTVQKYLIQYQCLALVITTIYHSRHCTLCLYLFRCEEPINKLHSVARAERLNIMQVDKMEQHVLMMEDLLIVM